MNNKGFAVSTILYGLSIMGFLIVLVLIGLMASSRSNSRDFVQQVEDELNRFSSKQTVITAHTDGGVVNPNYPQEFFTLEGTSAYWYKIELWNGNIYKSATFKVNPNTIIYFYIGDGENPTIACVDGDARENCAPDSENLIMSTAIDGDGINSKNEVTQTKDTEEVGDTIPRTVFLRGGNNAAQNTYRYETNGQNKARISLASMDDNASFVPNPRSDVAAVFYVGNNDGSQIATIDGNDCQYHLKKFTGDQNQQWTIIGTTATNVKFKNCTKDTSTMPSEYHNALF